MNTKRLCEVTLAWFIGVFLGAAYVAVTAYSGGPLMEQPAWVKPVQTLIWACFVGIGISLTGLALHFHRAHE